jgi:hypothetical protein
MRKLSLRPTVYATAGDELFIAVSHYDPYRKEIDQELRRIELRAKK